MKRILIFFILIICLQPLSSFAETKNITVEWEISDNSEIRGFKVYCAYDYNMSGKIMIGEIDNAQAIELTCSGVEINNFPIYITVAAVKKDNSEISSQAMAYGIAKPNNVRVLSQ